MHLVKLRHSEFKIHELTDPIDVENLCKRLLNEPEVGVDVETEELMDGWHPIGKAKCFSIQFGVGSDTWFIPTWGKYRYLLEILKPYLVDTRRTKILHHAIFDRHILANHGIEMEGLLCDTLVAEYTWYNDGFYPESGDRFPAHNTKVKRGLKELCSMYFDEDLPEYKDIFNGFTGKKKGGASWNSKGKHIKRNAYLQHLVDYERTIGGHEEIVEYSAKDPYLTYMLYKNVRKRLESEPWNAKSRKGSTMWDYFQEIEVPFSTALFRMERVGMPLDWDALGKLDDAFGADEIRLNAEWEEELRKAGAKHRYDITSPQQVATALVEVFGERLFKRGKTKANGDEGAFSVDKEVLKSISHPVAEIILAHREVSKAKGTYTETLKESYNLYDGMVYTNLGQTGTRTGRINSKDPNLLNQPSRTESGKAIRACFCAKDSREEIWCMDWDSAELKETYHFSREPVIKHILDQGLKPHAVTAGDIDAEAREWRNGRIDAVTYKELEKKFPGAYFKGKTFNFGVVYGMGYKKYAKMAKISESEAREAHGTYWKARPYLKKFRENQAAHAEVCGFVYNILKVPIWIAEVGSEDPERKSRAARKAGNSVIQSSIAARAKMVMILMTHDEDLKRDNCRLSLNIYDEFLFRAPIGAYEIHKESVEDKIRNPLKYFGVDAPDWFIAGDLGKGRNWKEAKLSVSVLGCIARTMPIVENARRMEFIPTAL